MTHEALKPEFVDLIDPDALVEQLATGFTFTEGPIWHPLEHYLLFSDMPAACGGAGTPGAASPRRAVHRTNATA